MTVRTLPSAVATNTPRRAGGNPLLPGSANDNRSSEDRAATTFREHRQTVYRYLLRRTSDHHEAEELTQRVFVDAAVALANAAFVPDSMLAWLYTVAERRLIDELRRRKSASQMLREVARTPRPAIVPEYGSSVVPALRSAIADLPVDQRSVVVMKILEEKTFAEIAAALATTEGACKMRFSRAVRTLRARLREESIR